MNLDKAKTIHFIGIGGIGMSGLARLFQSMGKQVTGSDIKDSDIIRQLQQAGMSISLGNNAVAGNPDLVIYTPALPEEEIQAISQPKLSQGQAVGALMENKYGIGVTGTNGKSTTTAILGLLLEAAGLDPMVLVGTLLSPNNQSDKFQANARIGSGKFFVAESDEFQRKMLENSPRMIVLTNIAEDHMDCYKDLEDIKQAFQQYVAKLPADGVVIYNADDHHAVEVGRKAHCHKFTYGIHHYADLQALNLKSLPGKQTFDLHLNDEKIGEFEIAVPGVYNVSNALGAALAAIKLGASVPVIQQVLSSFAGTWRRFELVGSLHGKPVISDYAHHPAGVLAALDASKQFFPGKKILVVFQPHHRNRTKSLFNEFVEALVPVENLIIPEIFDVAGREHGEDISSQDLVNEIRKQGGSALFANDLDDAKRQVLEKINDVDGVLMMGAGDIDLLARKIAK